MTAIPRLETNEIAVRMRIGASSVLICCMKVVGCSTNAYIASRPASLEP